MKKILTFSLLAASLYGSAQLPYFQREYNSSTTGIAYSRPVDIHYDGTSKVYTYHSVTTGGTIIATHDASTGALLNLTSLSKTGITYSPVRIRTQGGNHYALFNQPVSGTNRFCIVSLSATNTLNFSRIIAPVSGSIDYTGVDFVLDGGSNIYVLSNAYNAVNAENDLCVTKINTGTLAVVWNRVFPGTSRDELGQNIIYRSANEIYACGIYNTIPISLNRGPILLKLNSAGTLLKSEVYRYDSLCTSYLPVNAWVMSEGANLYLSTVTMDNHGVNGPFWIGKINPSNLSLIAAKHYSSNSAYLNAEIQKVTTSSGNLILMSGSSPASASSPGYVHLFFNLSSLSFNTGVYYNLTNSSPSSGDIYDTYISGTDKNIFSVALNHSNTAHYYLLKTSAFGVDSCEQLYTIDSINCDLDSILPRYLLDTTRVTFPTFKLIPGSIVNDSTDTCVVCDTCFAMRNAINGTNRSLYATIYPNPAHSRVIVETGDMKAESIQLFALTGTLIRSVTVNSLRTEMDVADLEKGLYLIQVNMGGRKKLMKFVKE